MLTLCQLGNFACFFCCLLIFSKSTFLKNSFRNTIRVSNSLETDQGQQFVGPDLSPNCLKRLYQQMALVGKELMYKKKTHIIHIIITQSPLISL